ncbi:MAG: hypothetical protein GY853_04955 [PVC group bacterium]|nr:hypothetical protein [PVC group bacterium]
MTIELIRGVLGWCSVINFGLFALSCLIMKLGHKFVYKMHGQWYDLPEEKVAGTLYSVMAWYKISILMFNVVPYIAFCIITK